jgi:hypothetical protein
MCVRPTVPIRRLNIADFYVLVVIKGIRELGTIKTYGKISIHMFRSVSFGRGESFRFIDFIKNENVFST